MPVDSQHPIHRRSLLALLPATALLAACGGGEEAPTQGARRVSFDPAAAVQIASGIEPKVAIRQGGDALVVYAHREGTDSVRARHFNGANGVFGVELVVHVLASGDVNVNKLRLGSNAQGTVVVAVWAETAVDHEVLRAAVYRDGAWQSPQQLSAYGGGLPPPPDVAFDAKSGDAMVVWTEPQGGSPSTRFTRWRADESVWEAARTVVHLAESGQVWSHEDLRLAPLPEGDFMLVASEHGPRPLPLQGIATYLAVYRYRSAEDVWVYGNAQAAAKPLYYLPDAPTDGHVGEFDVTLNGAGQLVVVWAQVRAPSTQVPPLPSRRSIHLARYSVATGAWLTTQDTVDVTSSGTSLSDTPGWISGYPQVVADASGKAMILWAQNETVGSGVFSLRYRQFDVAGNAFVGGVGSLEGSSGISSAPVLAPSGSSSALAVWRKTLAGNDKRGLHYSAYDSSTAVFSTAGLVANLPSSAGYLTLATGADGRVIVMWALSGREIFFNRST